MEMILLSTETVKPKVNRPKQCYACHSTYIVRRRNHENFKCAFCGKIL